MNWQRRVLFGLIIHTILLPSLAWALLAPDSRLSENLTDDERDVLSTLALADEPLRDAILDAALHPKAIAQIADIREASSDAFRERIASVPRSKQKNVWELVRYPELVDELVIGGRPSAAEIDDILARHPESIRAVARELALRDFDLLSDVAHIREDAERETARVIAPLDFEAQASFETLIERPDLMSALANEPGVALRLARHYRDDPGGTRALFDHLHEAEVEENNREIAQWRETIEEDPQAREELIESAERFAEEEGYESPSRTIVERREVHYYHNPYPYWYGPPHWRLGSYWYPHRAHWGFHIGFGSGFYVTALPSPVFSYWHYRRPHRVNSYRHLHSRWAHYGPRHHLHRSFKHRRHHIASVGRSSRGPLARWQGRIHPQRRHRATHRDSRTGSRSHVERRRGSRGDDRTQARRPVTRRDSQVRERGTRSLRHSPDRERERSPLIARNGSRERGERVARNRTSRSSNKVLRRGSERAQRNRDAEPKAETRRRTRSDGDSLVARRRGAEPDRERVERRRPGNKSRKSITQRRREREPRQSSIQRRPGRTSGQKVAKTRTQRAPRERVQERQRTSGSGQQIAKRQRRNEGRKSAARNSGPQRMVKKLNKKSRNKKQKAGQRKQGGDRIARR